MLRASRFFRARTFSLAEASALLSSKAPSSTTPLSDLVDILSQYGQSVPFAKKALPMLTEHDVTDEVSAELARGPGLTAVIQAMKASPVGRIGSDVAVSEHCCRAIANMAMVPGDATDATPSSATSSVAGQHPFANLLVEQEAVEMVVATMTLRAAELSPKGRCWVSRALLHLTLLSDEGAHRAVTLPNTDTIAVVSAFVDSLVDEHIEKILPRWNANPNSEDVQFDVFLSLTALDTALGTLCRLLSLEAPDNAKGIAFRYQSISFATVDAVSRCLRLIALQHPPADTGLPILHKLWDLLRMASSHPPNIGLVYDALSSPTGQSSVSLLRALEVTIQSLQSASESESLQFAVRQSCAQALVEAATYLTAKRTDIDPSQVVATEGGATTDTEEGGGVSCVLPTEAASTVIDTLSSGVLANFVVSEIAQTKWSTAEPTTALREEVRIVVKLIALLTSLGELDASSTALNTLTVLQSGILERYLREPSTAVKREMLPAVGQTLSWIWTLLNTKAGCDAAKLYQTKSIVQRLVDESKETIEAFAAAEAADASAGAPSTSSSTEASGNSSSAGPASEQGSHEEKKGTNPASTESLAQSFYRLSNQLLEKLDATVENPHFAHSSVTGVGRSK